jgi:hypothetical protein
MTQTSSSLTGRGEAAWGNGIANTWCVLNALKKKCTREYLMLAITRVIQYHVYTVYI